MPLRPYLRRLIEAREPLSREEAHGALRQILAAAAEAPHPITTAPHEIQLAALLGAIAARGETAAEIAGFADGLREVSLSLPLTTAERGQLVDTCGTGGDASGTFNISTAAALVAAAAGSTVAKHGNRAVTSRSGSADVLEALGIPVDLTPDAAATALRGHRFAFLHAPSLHPAMRAVMPVRRVMGVRTIFNVVGPLTNPAGAARQVMGVYAAHLVPLAAEAMALLGTERALVVHGHTTPTPGSSSPGIDELSISGPSQIAEVRNGTIIRYQLNPADLGLDNVPVDALRGGDAQENAAILRAIFAGETGPRRDIVLLNAAAVLLVADRVSDLADGIALAAKTIDSGAVTHLIQTLQPGSSLIRTSHAIMSQGEPTPRKQ